jgi:phosphoribosylformylglycinamidine (FGAM) synthase PurS component
MMGPGTNVQVVKVAKGVSFTMTGTDAKAVSRIQKMTDAMRLMHEAWQQ